MCGPMAWIIMSILIGAIPLANLIVPLMGVNFYTKRNYRESGQKMSFGELFDFNNALDKTEDQSWLHINRNWFYLPDYSGKLNSYVGLYPCIRRQSGLFLFKR